MASDLQLDMFKRRRQRGVKPKPPPEFNVHCAIADTLERWLMPGWKWWHTPNGGERTKRQNPKTGRWYSPEGQRLKRMGARKGVSDFALICKPYAQLHVYELKVEGEEPTEEQLEFGAGVEECGGVFAWGDTYKHAITTFQEWGALPTTIKVF